MVKTIDINAKEWFDKINGNSYFAGEVISNYGMKDQKVYKMPFQYGYGDQYIQEAGDLLDKAGAITREQYSNGGVQSLWQYCRDNNIILRATKQKALKRELKQY